MTLRRATTVIPDRRRRVRNPGSTRSDWIPELSLRSTLE